MEFFQSLESNTNDFGFLFLFLQNTIVLGTKYYLSLKSSTPVIYSSLAIKKCDNWNKHFVHLFNLKWLKEKIISEKHAIKKDVD